ncbi:MAG: ferritin-like domain-containing protein [Gammaproteobacteria bacterium]|nr:ferritin-like domain-containing protein [Gammaproteobacteria bacterium]
MVYANTDPMVLGFLGRALSLEMTAVQQYMTLSRVLHLRGFSDLSEKFRSEAMDEMIHVEKIISRMLILGVAPGRTQLRSARVENSLPELLLSASEFETEIVGFYQVAVNYCAKINDFDGRIFFEQLLADEKKHSADWVNIQQELSGMFNYERSLGEW